jgi:hypothetical protein
MTGARVSDNPCEFGEIRDDRIPFTRIVAATALEDQRW